MKLAEQVENHFPWYVDSSDTDNLDCQCGYRVSGGIAEWADHVAAVLEAGERP